MSDSTPSSASSAVVALNSTSQMCITTIDDLPESLIVHIISFLYIPEAIKTSLISREFRNLWQSIPSLHFDITEFYSRSTSPNPRSTNSRQQFAEFISDTLSFRPPNPLTEFHLTFEYTNFHHHKPYVQFWIQKAINLSVSQLILDFNFYHFEKWMDDSDNEDEDEYEEVEFYFHLMDITRSCIKVLKLYGCRLEIPSRTCTINFVSLKSLELDVLGMEYDDVSNLLERCLNLEIFKLIVMGFDSPGVLRICSPTIKELYMEVSRNRNYDLFLDFEICCPSLKKIGLSCSDVGKYVIKDITLLEEASLRLSYFGNIDKNWESMLSCFSSISSLNVWDKLLESNEVPAGCERLASNLKHLDLFIAYNDNGLVALAALLKLFPRLETLQLRNRGASYAKLHQDCLQASTVFNMPRLRKVVLRNYLNLKCEHHFIELFRKCGIVLENIVLIDRH